MSDSTEKVLYSGGPSQMVNLQTYIFCGLLIALAVIAPAFWHKVFIHSMPKREATYFGVIKLIYIYSIFKMLKTWLVTNSHKYQLTTQRLKETEGIFSRTTNELELFRVRDMTFSEPVALRMVGCADIILNTTDKTTPVVVLHGLKNARPVMEMLRKNVDAMRTAKGVRDIEM